VVLVPGNQTRHPVDLLYKPFKTRKPEIPKFHYAGGVGANGLLTLKQYYK
jgi:hypothetical protein